MEFDFSFHKDKAIACKDSLIFLEIHISTRNFYLQYSKYMVSFLNLSPF